MPTLKFGATTYLIPKFLFSFPVRLIEYLDIHKINTICWVVSALVQISCSERKIRTEISEDCRIRQRGFPENQYRIWRAALPRQGFSIFTTYGQPNVLLGGGKELAPGEPIPIGRPFENTEIILLDEENKRVTGDGVGEICIRGTCVTLGYYNNPQKTAEVFVQNPLNPAYPELIYRTGDLGRYNEYGELVFVARRDSQIKHMGHRIELAEIEAAAAKNTGIARACAVYDAGEKKITLFYTVVKEEISPGELTAFLSGLLPRYMLPGECVKVDEMPYTVNGKLDRAGLLARAKERNSDG